MLERSLLFIFVACGVTYGADRVNLLPTPGSDGWSQWSPRQDIAPLAKIEKLPDGNALSLTSRGFESYGKWVARVGGIEPGKFYRFQVQHRASHVESEETSVCVLLTWLGGRNCWRG